jgi:hypothetical protein
MVDDGATNTAARPIHRKVQFLMHQQRIHNTGFLRSIGGTFGEVQIVAVSNRVVVDLQTQNYDTGGFLNRKHALASLPLDAAVQLRDLLSEAIVAAENARPHHPGIWSDATNRAVSHRMSRRGVG